jgi:hypothetical protein
LYLIDVPEDAIFETKDGARGFNVGFSDLSYGPDITCFLSGHYVGASFDVIVG